MKFYYLQSQEYVNSLWSQYDGHCDIPWTRYFEENATQDLGVEIIARTSTTSDVYHIVAVVNEAQLTMAILSELVAAYEFNHNQWSILLNEGYTKPQRRKPDSLWYNHKVLVDEWMKSNELLLP